MKTDQPTIPIGPELRQARIERGITASFVARKLGVSTTMLHDLEFDKRTWTEAYVDGYRKAIGLTEMKNTTDGPTHG